VTRIILDTDLAMGAPGSDIDDGFALALAVADPELTLELVTTVDGNTDVVTATRLTKELLARLGPADVPVVRGAVGPIHPRPGRTAPLGEVPRGLAAAEIVERVLAAPDELTLVAIGPLTNVALAVLLEPQVAFALREIVVMGGIYFQSTNEASIPGEWNFWCDPDAAAIVLACGARLRLVGLDVTRQVRLTRADTEAMAGAGGSFAPFAAACGDGWIDHLEQTGEKGGPPGSCALHDPLAVAAVSRPELLTFADAFVQVETSSEVTRGVAVADLLQRQDPPSPNCQVATAVDAAGFRRHFLEQLATLP
jgi:purine nucleosidase